MKKTIALGFVLIATSGAAVAQDVGSGAASGAAEGAARGALIAGPHGAAAGAAVGAARGATSDALKPGRSEDDGAGDRRPMRADPDVDR